MEKVDYSKVINRDAISGIKSRISACGYKFDYSKCLEIDTIFSKKLDDLFNDREDANDLRQLLTIIKYKKNNDIESVITMYYFALYNDNVNILRNLLVNNIKLKSEFYQYQLFALDKDFTKYFNIHDLVLLFKTSRFELSSFYKKCFLSKKIDMDFDRKTMLIKRIKEVFRLLLNDKLKKEERDTLEKEARSISFELNSNTVSLYSTQEIDSLMRDFVYIISRNPYICGTDINDVSNYCHNYLTPENIKYLGRDILLMANDNQRRFIDSCYSHKVEGSTERVKQIIYNYPTYSNGLFLSREILDAFTNEELFRMSEREIFMYKAASRIGVVKRVKDLYLNGFDFSQVGLPMIKEIFAELSDSEILGLSFRDIKRITIFYNLNRNESPHVIRKGIRSIVNRNSFVQKVIKIIG